MCLDVPKSIQDLKSGFWWLLHAFAKCCKKIGKPGRPKVPLAGSYVKQSVVRFCCSFFRNGKGRKKFNHPNVVHVIVPPVKKNRFSSSFHFCRTECAWMCHLSVPWQPPGKPPKVSKSCFWLFLHVFAKCCKKNKKLGRPKVLNLWLHPLWKRWFWGVTLHFFGSDTPGITWLCHHSVPWQPPTSCVEKHGPPKNVHPLLVARSTWKRAFFSRTSHRHRALLRFFFHVRHGFPVLGWGGVG